MQWRCNSLGHFPVVPELTWRHCKVLIPFWSHLFHFGGWGNYQIKNSVDNFQGIYSACFFSGIGLLRKMACCIDGQWRLMGKSFSSYFCLLYNLNDGHGHLGVWWTTDLIRQICYWPGTGVEIERYYQHCQRCILSKAIQPGVKTYQVVYLASQPLEVLASILLFWNLLQIVKNMCWSWLMFFRSIHRQCLLKIKVPLP